MANKNLFASYVGKLLPRANAKNRAGAPAYSLDARHQLAQLAMTGTLSRDVLRQRASAARRRDGACRKLEPAFVAKAAIYARQKRAYEGHAGPVARGDLGGRSGDVRTCVPARGRQRQDAAHVRADHALGCRGAKVARFASQAHGGGVVDDGHGSPDPGAAVGQHALARGRHQDGAPQARLGGAPGALRLVDRQAVRCRRVAAMPCVPSKRSSAIASNPVPDVPFQMLTSLELTPQHWAQIAENAGWQMLRHELEHVRPSVRVRDPRHGREDRGPSEGRRPRSSVRACCPTS